MAAFVQLLNFCLLLFMSSKAVCQDSWQGAPLNDLRPCSSVDLPKVNYLLGDASASVSPSVLECSNFMFVERDDPKQLAIKSVEEKFHLYHGRRALHLEHGEDFSSSRIGPLVHSSSMPAERFVPPELYIKSHAPSASSRNLPHRKRHHRHHPHFAVPPVTSSQSPSRMKLAPSLPPLRSPGKRPVRIFLPPQVSPSPAPKQRPPLEAAPPYSSPSHYHRQANAPISTPAGSDHQNSAPLAMPPKSSSEPSPVPSSQSPPTEDCGAVVCLPPLTKTAFMSPCGCVRPIQVQIQLTVPLYALFPSISVLAANIADGIVLAPSQVEITGANADNDDPDYSIVVVNLVPLDPEFDNLTAFLIFQKFWKHEVPLNASLFGNYSVLYVQYPGLPPSPPGDINSGGFSGTVGNSSQDPLGVDVNQKSHKLGIVIIIVIALSSAFSLAACLGALWFFSRRYGHSEGATSKSEPKVNSTRTKKSAGGRSLLFSDLGSSSCLSLSSSMATYASNARTFALAELEKATGNFKSENVIGEGGFGRVYCGTLDDGTKVAVKVLTRDQGGKEFISEVEMLSRLHHRNLVKLIGICTEEHTRCLVYELIPNGSVESHLHGADKESSPLDWEARMKIALGAARGLAYLHEDSNPRVIHRDFKASNILLETDFTPKVSDFGLAKVAPDEGREHLSTRVMGTFGYVAPEYAMTGHLLVKSDVYSYGVVLLELLSGRQPVDILKPTGQANLVTWARPLLTTREGLEQLVDPALGGNFLFDNLVRVAAIASMCVHPEVSHRPFMGEVVQALKLVYNDTEVQNGIGSSNASQEDDSLTESGDAEQVWLDQKAKFTLDGSSFISIDYDSGPSQVGNATLRRPLSASALFPESLRFSNWKANIFRRHSLSGPLRSHTGKLDRYKLRTTNRQGSISEHVALSRNFGTEMNRDFP